MRIFKKIAGKQSSGRKDHNQSTANRTLRRSSDATQPSVFFTHDAFSIQRVGGVSRYIAELHRNLPDHGIDSLVLAPLTANEYARDLPRLRGRYVDMSMWPRATEAVFKVAAVFDEGLAIRRPDIIHESYFQYFHRRHDRAKRAITVYDMIHEKYPEFFSDGGLTARLKRQAVGRADVIFAISQTTKDDLVRINGVDPQSIIITPLASSLPVGGDVPSVSQPQPYLLMVGSRRGHKNGMKCLEAYARSGLASETRLVLFGGGALSRDETELLRRYGAQGSVVQLSGNDRRLVSHYRSALGLVYPSLYEGFGLPVVEAMSQGCPLLIASTPALVETAGDAASYLDPTDIDAMAFALRRFTESDENRRNLVSRAQNRVRSFTWSATASKTAEGYRRILQW